MPSFRLTALSLFVLSAACATEVGTRDLLMGHGGAPVPLVHSPPGEASAGLELTEVSLSVPGALLRGRLQRRANARRALLWFYGNGDSVASSARPARNLAEALNADLLVADYRGYGASTGTPGLTELGVDGLAVYDWLALLDPGKPIVVAGHSLGAGLSVHVAAHRPAAGVLLFSPPPSITAVIPAMQALLPWPVRWFVELQADAALAGFHPVPEEEAPLVSAPALVVIGARDRLVLPEGSRRLFAKLGSAEKQVCEVDAGHNQTQPARAEALACAAAFLAAHPLPAPDPDAPGPRWQRLASGGANGASLRGLSAPSSNVVWASGAKGTVLRSLDGGATFQPRPIPGAEALDFRALHALDESTAWALAAGVGPSGRIYQTIDGGARWTLQVQNPEPTGFLDALAFWDAQHGVALGDPVRGRFQVLVTSDGGHTWAPVPATGLPEARAGEGAFAASGTCLTALTPETGSAARSAWFVTGGPGKGRVFRTSDGGATWAVSETPVASSADSEGLFGVAFPSASTGVVVGGDYRQKNALTPSAARTTDGGQAWQPVSLQPEGFYSGITVVPGAPRTLVATGLAGTSVSTDDGATWQPADPAALHAAVFPAPGVGYGVGPRGLIVKWQPAPAAQTK